VRKHLPRQFCNVCLGLGWQYLQTIDETGKNYKLESVDCLNCCRGRLDW